MHTTAHLDAADVITKQNNRSPLFHNGYVYVQQKLIAVLESHKQYFFQFRR